MYAVPSPLSSAKTQLRPGEHIVPNSERPEKIKKKTSVLKLETSHDVHMGLLKSRKSGRRLRQLLDPPPDIFILSGGY